MADVNTLTRPGGSFRDVLENDIIISGGLKTTSNSTNLSITTAGTSSNISIGTLGNTADITISGNQNASIRSGSGGVFDIRTGATPTQRLQIDGSGNYDVDTASFDLDASGSIDLTSVDVMTIETTVGGGKNLTISSGAILDLNATTAVTIDAITSSNFTVTGTAAVNLTLAATTSSGNANVLITADSEVDITSDNIDLNADGDVTVDGGTFSINSTGDSNITVTGAGTISLSISATSATSDADVNISADAEIDLTSDSVDINATNAININAGATSTFVVDNGDLTIGTTTSGNVTISGIVNTSIRSGSGVFDIRTNTTPVQRLQIDSSGNYDLDAAAFDLDASGSVDITSVDAMTIETTVGGGKNLTFGALGGTITLNESGETSLDGSFTATSIVGALNELKSGSGTITFSGSVASSGTNTVIDTLTDGYLADGAAIWEYWLYNTANGAARSGRVSAHWDISSGTISNNDVAVSALAGGGESVDFNVAASGNDIVLRASETAGAFGYTIQGIRRVL